MTPYETMMSIDAFIWRDERDSKAMIKLAWDIAMLSRQKRIPTLKSLLQKSEAPKALKGRELRERRNEFKSMTRGLDLDALNKKMKNKKQVKDG